MMSNATSWEWVIVRFFHLRREQKGFGIKAIILKKANSNLAEKYSEMSIIVKLQILSLSLFVIFVSSSSQSVGRWDTILDNL